MKKILNKTLLLLVGLVFSVGNMFAENPPVPSGVPGGPPGSDGGNGGTTPGAPASSIDMYVWVLAIIAVLFIVQYVYQLQKRKKLA